MITPVTKEQFKKVLKALGYAFVSTFIATNERTLVAAAVAGINAVLVYIKMLFTEA